MTSAFTSEQEKRLRQIVAEEIEIAVAVGVGDSTRLLRKLAFMRAEIMLGTHADLPRHERLVQLSHLSLDQVNAEHGIASDFAGPSA